MTRVDVLGQVGDDSALYVVGRFDSDDVEVFEQEMPPSSVLRCLLSRSDKQEVCQQLLRTGQGQWVLRLDFGRAEVVEHRYVDDEVASAWLYRNGYIESALEA